MLSPVRYRSTRQSAELPGSGKRTALCLSKGLAPRSLASVENCFRPDRDERAAWTIVLRVTSTDDVITDAAYRGSGPLKMGHTAVMAIRAITQCRSTLARRLRSYA